MGGAILSLPIRNSHQRLSLFSKGLPFAAGCVEAESAGSSFAGRAQLPVEESVAFGRAIAASSCGEVLHFNLGMEDQWG